MERKGRHDYLRENESVMRWYRNIEQGAKITADVYIRTFGLYCKENNSDPNKILEDARTGKLRIEFMDFVHKQIANGKAGSYILRFKKIIASWVKFNGLEPGLSDVKIRGSNVSPTVMDERVPQKEELSKILRMATSRGKAIIGLLAFSGLRPESLGNYDGSDAIKIGDVEGLSINGDHVEFSNIPAVLKVRQSVKAQLSKKGHSYITFIPKQTLDYIKDYLDYRLKQGEALSPDSPIVTVDPKGNQHRKFGDVMSTAILTRDVRDAIRNAGFSWRPYVMRSYFSSALDVCEAKGLVSHNWREFWHGHQGDISARYSTNKNLAPEIVEEMRNAFVKCAPWLETDAKPISESDVESLEKNITVKVLKKFGFSDKEIEDMQGMDDESFQKTYRKKRGMESNNGHKQKVIPQNEIKHYIEDLGWEYVKDLNARESIVRLPD